MFRHPKSYDVIVIGAGHAGVEAVLAAARLGAEGAGRGTGAAKPRTLPRRPVRRRSC